MQQVAALEVLQALHQSSGGSEALAAETHNYLLSKQVGGTPWGESLCVEAYASPLWAPSCAGPRTHEPSNEFITAPQPPCA